MSNLPKDKRTPVPRVIKGSDYPTSMDLVPDETEPTQPPPSTDAPTSDKKASSDEKE